MAVETPEPPSSSRLCPQIQLWQTEARYSWRDVGLYEHSFALQSYWTFSVAMGNSTYLRFHDVKVCKQALTLNKPLNSCLGEKCK